MEVFIYPHNCGQPHSPYFALCINIRFLNYRVIQDSSVLHKNASGTDLDHLIIIRKFLVNAYNSGILRKNCLILMKFDIHGYINFL